MKAILVLYGVPTFGQAWLAEVIFYSKGYLGQLKFYCPQITKSNLGRPFTRVVSRCVEVLAST